ncbi:hypothetical protein [Nitriliruptor alkaliphilus]|uniref:hypothetical protein n=1 Tax=Nitriliruptor alkaliphilus TaxID=427918 RepID=UPI00069727D4|nr:hypothetical protein [Nitriliruptor alkaliphilus]
MPEVPPPPGVPLYGLLAGATPPFGDLALPDEPLTDGPGAGRRTRFAAGAADAIVSRTTRRDAAAQERAAAPIVAALVAAGRSSSPDTWWALHDLAGDTATLDHVDATLATLTTGQHVPAATVWELGWWLATRGSRREAVKLGIALLGLTAVGTEADHLHVLGSHEELTLYVALAFSRGFADADDHLWALARDTRGWGRIWAVEQLSPSMDPVIAAWLLRDGYHNTVDIAETAAHVVDVADLAGALEGEDDEALLDGAAELLTALCRLDGPHADLRDVADGGGMVLRFLERVGTRAPTEVRRRAVAAIAEVDVAFASGGAPPSWTPEVSADVAARTRSLLGR